MSGAGGEVGQDLLVYVEFEAVMKMFITTVTIGNVQKLTSP